jgi:protein gp37
MADKTHIEWTDATWNPISGCSRVSEGCRNCYAEALAARFNKPGLWGEGLATMVRTPDGKAAPRWTGEVRLNEAALDRPLRWRKPRRIFVNSTSDLFHGLVPDKWIDKIFAVMALCPQHTFQVLTKRPERMREYIVGRRPAPLSPLEGEMSGRTEGGHATASCHHPAMDYAALMAATGKWRTPALDLCQWPLPNVWLGTSVEDQETADTRIPQLLATPSAVRFLSAEPLLGPVDLTDLTIRVSPGEEPSGLAGVDGLTGVHWDSVDTITGIYGNPDPRIDWVIVGGESGPGARPMDPDWARKIRDQCAEAGVAFFFKQWGEWTPGENCDHIQTRSETVAWRRNGEWSFCSLTPFASQQMHRDDEPDLFRVGKRRAGRMLDGITHDAMPEVHHD